MYHWFQGQRTLPLRFSVHSTIALHFIYIDISDQGVPAGTQMTCGNEQITSSKYRCIVEFDEYNVIHGCRDMSHLDGCGKLTWIHL